MKIKILICLFTYLFIGLFAGKSFAQDKVDLNTNQQIKSILNVSPIIINASLEKDKSQSFEIKITNLLNQPLGINASIEDFAPNDEGVIQSNQQPSPLLNWSSLSETNFILDQGENKTITLDIHPPKNLKDGGYYELIFLTPFYSKQQNPNSPTVLTKIGLLVLANAGTLNYNNLQSKVSIDTINLPILNEKLPIDLSFHVQNKYFNYFTAKPFLAISPLFGKKQDFTLEEKKVFPGKSRSWSEIINLNSKNNIFYKAHLAVSVGQGHLIYKDFFFFILPIKEILCITLMLLLLVFLRLRGKQFKKAIKIIFKG